MAQLPHGCSSRRPRSSAPAHDNGLLWPIPDPPMQPNLAAMPQDHGRVQVKKASKKGMQHAPTVLMCSVLCEEAYFASLPAICDASIQRRSARARRIYASSTSAVTVY